MSPSTASVSLLLSLALGAAAVPTTIPVDGSAAATTGKAIYFITNDQQNAVGAIPIGEDGMLYGGSLTPTGGEGSNAIDGESDAGDPIVPDALVSQSALTMAGQFLFAVNAASNTVSMLCVDPSDPTSLIPVGEPAQLPGEFPNTIAASETNGLVCVGMTGAASGVSCASFDGASGLGAFDDARSFDDELGQSTPPVGPVNTVSHVFWSSDESMLFATVKGDPEGEQEGFLAAWSVERADGDGEGGAVASVAAQETRSTPEGTLVLFGSAAIPQGRAGDAGNATGGSMVFATDASFGAAVLSVDPETMEASTVAMQEIEGQMATCWAAISDVTDSAFVTDVGVNRVIEMSLDDASILGETDLSVAGGDNCLDDGEGESDVETEAGTETGLIDLATGGNFLYALAPGDGTSDAMVSVLDISGGQGTAELVQMFSLAEVGVGENSMGMVVMM